MLPLYTLPMRWTMLLRITLEYLDRLHFKYDIAEAFDLPANFRAGLTDVATIRLC